MSNRKRHKQLSMHIKQFKELLGLSEIDDDKVTLVGAIHSAKYSKWLLRYVQRSPWPRGE